VQTWGGYSSLFGPMVALLAITVLVTFLRWAHRPGASLVAKQPSRGRADQYGLLVPVASPGTYVEGELVRRKLEAEGVRATLASTNDGPRVMVWPEDEAKARSLLTAW
jgi:hypothetical protein